MKQNKLVKLVCQAKINFEIIHKKLFKRCKVMCNNVIFF